MWRIVSIGALAAFALTVLAWHQARAAGAVPEDQIKKMTEAIPAKAPATPAKPRKILIYSHCNGFNHSGAIERTKIVLPLMGEKTGAYTAVVSDDLSNFEPEKLAQFDLVVLSNTTGELFKNKAPGKPRQPDAKKIADPAKLKEEQDKYAKALAGYEEEMKKFQAQPDRSEALRKSFMDWIKAGGGVFGIHAATDCSYQWKEFGDMIGGYFAGHPWAEKVGVKIDDPTHPINAPFEGKGFEIGDEIYIFRDPYSRDKQRVLLSLDMAKTSPKKGRADNDHAVSWVKMYGKGRVFYCSLGHWDAIFWNPQVLAHYLAGMQWAMGDLKADCTPVPLKAAESK